MVAFNIIHPLYNLIRLSKITPILLYAEEKWFSYLGQTSYAKFLNLSSSMLNSLKTFHVIFKTKSAVLQTRSDVNVVSYLETVTI